MFVSCYFLKPFGLTLVENSKILGYREAKRCPSRVRTKQAAMAYCRSGGVEAG